MLNTFTPDLYVQYFRDLRDAVAAGGSLSSEALTDVMARYATETVRATRVSSSPSSSSSG